MKLCFGCLARHVALSLLMLTLLVGSLAVAAPGLALAQNTAQDLYNQGRDLIQQQDYAGAVDAFSRALSMDPNLAAAYVGRATAYLYQGDLQAAIEDYNQALQRDPNMAEALYNRGVALAQSGDTQGAIRDLQRAAQLFRDRGEEQTANLVSQALDALQQ